MWQKIKAYRAKQKDRNASLREYRAILAIEDPRVRDEMLARLGM